MTVRPNGLFPSMRVSTAFFYAIVFVAATLTLYFMLELMSSRRPSPATELTPSDKPIVAQLEEKLAAVEATIKKNQELVAGLQAKLSYMLREQVPVVQEHPVTDKRTTTLTTREHKVRPEGMVEVARVAGVEGSADQCPALKWTMSKADVQMLKAYDIIPFDNPDGGVWKQGWNVSYSPSQWSQDRPLQVFIIPHSHNDPGWLETFEKYYEKQTKNIFDLMVKKLPVHSKRKFIWCEISYLSLWFQTASEEQKNVFKKLVKEGQVEIVTGGWVMPDEANSHYFALVNQLVEGHEWIRNHLGPHVVPKNGWAIDPFGFSPTIAYMDKLMKFDAMLIQRVHYSVKKYLAMERALEFHWRQNWDQEGKTDIFTHLMPFYSYDIPHTCGPDPKICCQYDFKRLPGTGRVSCPWKIPPRVVSQANVQERSETLLDQYRKKSQLYRTNILMAPLGDDFRYDTSSEWDQQYINYEKIRDFINSHPEYNAQFEFGTLNDYFTAVKEESLDSNGSSLAFPTLTGDFFTYADRDDHYWSGYYTTRPFWKMMERTLEARLRATEIAFAMYLARAERRKQSSETATIDAQLQKLVQARRNLALFQHHDGITGTGRLHVVMDYAMKMIGALDNCGQLLSRSLSYLLATEKKDDSEYVPGPKLRVTEVFQYFNQPSRKERLIVDQSGMFVVVSNSLGWTRSEVVTVRVNNPRVAVVMMENKKVVPAQLSPVWVGKTEKVEKEEFELTFIATVGALGAVTYMVVDEKAVIAGDRGHTTTHVATPAKLEVFLNDVIPVESSGVFAIQSSKYASGYKIENDHFIAEFDGQTGYLQKVIHKESRLTFNTRIKFVKYGTSSKPDKSGAYLFLPDGDAVDYVPQTEKGGRVPVILRLVRGPLISELHVVMTEVVHIVRVVHSPGVDGQALMVENRADITRQYNYELAMHIQTNISNKDLVTDLNGFQLIRRVAHAKLPLQANYYPMPTTAFLEDETARLTVLTGQPLGVAGLQKGALEIMLDRRLAQDDNRGMGQSVADNVPATPSFFRLLLEPNPGQLPAKNYPLLSLSAYHAWHSLLYPMATLMAEKPAEPVWWADTLVGNVSGLVGDLPCDVHLVGVRTAVAAETDDGMVSAGKQGTGESTEGPTALLMLHRGAVDCRGRTAGVRCSMVADGKINLKTAFTGLFTFPYVEEGSPSQLHKGQLLPADATVILQPMHIRAFRFPLL
ncbi:alpha-mannosidase 2-like [Paramacrobiotus metropolitanus]|uniref:alpha-mannosidase 2-like n=1 Tax=Paramacrobiotus metropolitanus TaxID=2943436 RepID=UPI002445BDE9|nr:alpha-mannosidase 2-like [Paramacrobiotus metropolitanus]